MIVLWPLFEVLRLRYDFLPITSGEVPVGKDKELNSTSAAGSGPDPEGRSASWLWSPPTLEGVKPPIRTRPQLLPLGDLEWEDFERLCLRLLEIDQEDAEEITAAEVYSVESTEPSVGMYGTRGQAQFGIDVYARDRIPLGTTAPQRTFVSLQSRRIKEVSPTGLRGSVNDFRMGHWAQVSRKFVYATSASTISTQLDEEKRILVSQLAEQSIEFEVWDSESISRRLKEHPRIVDDFFGRPWTEELCGIEAAQELVSRLDGRRVAELRRDLGRIYTAHFGVNDSGLIALRFGTTQPLGLRERFITPDLLSITPEMASLAQPIDGQASTDTGGQDPLELMEEAETWDAIHRDEGNSLLRRIERKQHQTPGMSVLDRRSADQWIGSEEFQAIVGDPGAGKSTLLRYLVLDLLSEKPAWQAVVERWGQRLPVWLPFHFFTQRLSDGTGETASVTSTIKAWLEQHDAGETWRLVQAALNDKRLLLIVDGLDEWVNEEAGRAALKSLETFATSRSTPLIVTARPYGIGRMTLGPGWNYKRIAPLTIEQQRLLATHYFGAVTSVEEHTPSTEVIANLVDDFLQQVHETPDIRAISGNPLFLILLIALRLSRSTRMPTERFELYEAAVQLLIDDHPANRRAAATATAPRQRLERRLRETLSQVAFINQVRGQISTFREANLREDLVVALRDPENLAMNALKAADSADQLLAIAEGEIGLLIRQGPTELGFLHRVLQEQLTAEYMSNRLDVAELKELFDKHMGDPRWREVILATMWKIRRPSELRELAEIIRSRIDESPEGLQAREILAEITFGPYKLPAAYAQQIIGDIVHAIETHPYDPHRARLLDSLLTGIDGTATSSIVQGCLERWTLLVQEPSSDLVLQISQLPSDEELSDSICKCLLMALRSPHQWIVYAGAKAIASRCSSDGIGIDQERRLLFDELLRILSNPPSGLVQSAALTALALGWREDPKVQELLNEARSHSADSVRFVALSDAIGVLQSTYLNDPKVEPKTDSELTDSERSWLIDHLRAPFYSDIDNEILIATLSETIRNDQAARERLLEWIEFAEPPLGNFDIPVLVALNVLADDERFVNVICNQFTAEEYPILRSVINRFDDNILSRAFPPESAHYTRVVAAIESRLRKYGGRAWDRELYYLAAIDRGSIMKQTLLESLGESGFPHWAAGALAKYFGDDKDVQVKLRSTLLGEGVRASMIVSVAPQVLSKDEIIPRLLAILEDLDESENEQRGRPDFVGYVLVQAFLEQEISLTPENEEIFWKAFQLLPEVPVPFRSDPRYELASIFYPSDFSKRALGKLEAIEDRLIEPFLGVYRNEPKRVKPFLEEASNVLCSLPAHLRARICHALTEQVISPEVVLRLTRGWADEASSPNKSIASLAYHQALLKGREEGYIDEEEWNLSLSHLETQASCYGFDYEARRRGAWVGMCVLREWSVVENRVQTRGADSPVGVRLTDPVSGADLTLLQQLASSWEHLRTEFGDTLLVRLSGNNQKEPAADIWNSLALVSEQNSVLRQELEDEVAEHPELRKYNGVLTWFVTRENARVDEVADALCFHLKNTDYSGRSIAGFLLAECDRIGLRRQELGEQLELSLEGVPGSIYDPLLEAFALLTPEHPVVRNAWEEISEIIATRRSPSERGIFPPNYFAATFAAADSSDILREIDMNFARLDREEHAAFDNMFTRHVVQRVRRDPIVADLVRSEVLNRATVDSRAARFVSILSDAIGTDEEVLQNIKHRLVIQEGVALAQVARDPSVSATLSVRTILMRVLDMSLESRM